MKYVSTVPFRNFWFSNTFNRKGMFVCSKTRKLITQINQVYIFVPWRLGLWTLWGPCSFWRQRPADLQRGRSLWPAASRSTVKFGRQQKQKHHLNGCPCPHHCGIPVFLYIIMIKWDPEIQINKGQTSILPVSGWKPLAGSSVVTLHWMALPCTLMVSCLIPSSGRVMPSAILIWLCTKSML